jgi:2,3-dihydroxybenzoate-AMP ligase
MIPAVQVWPEDFAARYRERGYWTGETLGEHVRRWAERTPDATAVVDGERRWSYAELNARADSIARGFLAAGFVAGDRVIVQLPNIAEFLSVVYGLYRTGILPVFALPAHRSSEITHFAQASEARGYAIADVHAGFDYRKLAREVQATVPALAQVFVVGEPEEFRSLESLAATNSDSALPELSASSVAFLQLSGGSTGLSKLIPRTHDDYLYSVVRSAEICELSERTVYMAALPIAHNYPMSSPGYLGVFYAGGTVVMCPSPDAATAFALIANERVTITGVVPPIALMWLDAARSMSPDLSSLEVLQVGGAKLSPEVAKQVTPVLGAKLQQVFGMAEGLVNYTRLDDPLDIVVHTQGRPMCPGRRDSNRRRP